MPATCNSTNGGLHLWCLPENFPKFFSTVDFRKTSWWLFFCGWWDGLYLRTISLSLLLTLQRTWYYYFQRFSFHTFWRYVHTVCFFSVSLTINSWLSSSNAMNLISMVPDMRKVIIFLVKFLALAFHRRWLYIDLLI